jgi:hypothetical protein
MPQAVLGLRVELSVGLPSEEAAKNRLHYVLGVFFLSNSAVELLSSQSDQPPYETVVDFTLSVLVAAAQTCNQIIEGRVLAHGSPFGEHQPVGASGVIIPWRDERRKALPELRDPGLFTALGIRDRVSD